MELKEVLRGAYPQFWSAPHLFESQWVKCLDSIGQTCKRVRNKKKDSRQLTSLTFYITHIYTCTYVLYSLLLQQQTKINNQ